MRTVTQREFRNNSAAIMDAVEAGESLIVTRNGVEIAEVTPVRRPKPTTEELIELFRTMPPVDYEEMRREADEFFGGPDYVGDDDDPFERRRG